MGEMRVVYRVFVGNMRERDQLEDPGVYQDNMMDVQEMGCGRMDWIELARVRDRRQALVYAVMNFRVPYNVGNLSTS